MYIRSTRPTHFARAIQPPDIRPREKESWSVPQGLSLPRSTLSDSNKLFKAAQELGVMENPLPRGVQRTVSALGAGFALANVGAELWDGDYKGALRDVAGGAVSLTGGAKLLGLPEEGAGGMYAAGALLNAAFVFDDLENGERLDAGLRAGEAVGMALCATDALLGSSVNAALGPTGLVILGALGLVGICRDVLEDE